MGHKEKIYDGPFLSDNTYIKYIPEKIFDFHINFDSNMMSEEDIDNKNFLISDSTVKLHPHNAIIIPENSSISKMTNKQSVAYTAACNSCNIKTAIYVSNNSSKEAVEEQLY